MVSFQLPLKKKRTDRQKRLQYALKKIQESRHRNDNNGYLRKLSLCAFLCFFSFILLNNEHAPFAIKKCQDCVLFQANLPVTFS